MNATNDPLGWRGTSAPSLAEFEALAIEAFRRLPDNFRAMCADLVIKIDDFATERCSTIGRAQRVDVSAFQGSRPAVRSKARRAYDENDLALRADPRLWPSTNENAEGAIVTHVLVHEIGHHFGMSDADMENIERAAD